MDEIMDIRKFNEKYAKFFVERFVYGTVEVEKPESKKEKERLLRNTLEAFKYLQSKPEDEHLNIGDIRFVGDKVNEGEEVPQNFRRIDVDPGDKAGFIPSEPEHIINDLNQLLAQYYYMWEGIDPFLKEAMFHIAYMRIHPFEDGNKRSAKLITTTNLLKQNIPPVIITKADIDEYYRFINTQDYMGFAEFLRQRSNIENLTMVGFYKATENIPILEDIDNKTLQQEVDIANAKSIK